METVPSDHPLSLAKLCMRFSASIQVQNNCDKCKIRKLFQKLCNIVPFLLKTYPIISNYKLQLTENKLNECKLLLQSHLLHPLLIESYRPIVTILGGFVSQTLVRLRTITPQNPTAIHHRQTPSFPSAKCLFSVVKRDFRLLKRLFTSTHMSLSDLSYS